MSPYIPEKPGSAFTGWFFDPECTDQADDQECLNSDKTLYAGCELQKRTLTFETNGSNHMDPFMSVYGSTVDLGSFITRKAGYRFTGWYTDSECINAAGDQITLDTDTILYAGWTLRPGMRNRITGWHR